MGKKLLVLNVVGLSQDLLGADAPHLSRLAEEGFKAALMPVLPALTCPAQATLLTGVPPREHGIVGNGWYFRELSEIWFWRQSNRLVQHEKIWEKFRRRRPDFTCATLFWWYNMYSSAAWTVTPRPVYHADGRKSPGIYTQPPELKAEIEAKLGKFPLFKFWGPAAGIESSRWIAECALQIFESRLPDLTLVYLPHLDYDLQRFGPEHPAISRAVREVDQVAGRLIDSARRLEAEVLVVSEYAIRGVGGSVSINRLLRREGCLQAQDTLAGELLDAGASRAFAVSDHQVAHVYVQKPAEVPAIKKLLEAAPEIDQVLDADGKAAFGLDHPRSGELIAISKSDRWFDYAYWLDDLKAPDFARTVDIHRKPGYDPLELLTDPEIPLLKLRIAFKLLKKALGLRMLMDVIPLDTSLIRGSHGRLPDDERQGPVLISSTKDVKGSRFQMAEVPRLIEEIINS